MGRLNDDSFRPLQTAGLQGNSLSYRNSRIEELKEISGNRDMTQGGTAGGVTAASAIAALQEACLLYTSSASWAWRSCWTPCWGRTRRL